MSQVTAIVLRWEAMIVALVALLAPPAARAQTDEIQVYDAEIAPVGVFNLTWHDNYTVDGARSPNKPGGVVPDHSLNGVTEWAYGVTEWFEAGLYLPLYSRTSRGAILYDGLKVRMLLVEPDAAHHRFVYGANFEFSVNTDHWDSHRYTSEIRSILGWHLGRIDLIFNAILDNSYEGVSSLDFAPATRLAFNATRALALAAEEYDDFGPLRHFFAHEQQSHQLFGVIDYRASPWSIEAGIGFGLTAATQHRMLKLILSCDLNRRSR